MINHFTVIIPAYNCQNWVEWNLNSVLRQDYDNSAYDIVYVDDHSSDNTHEMVNKIHHDSKKKFKIISNDKNQKALYNLYTHIHLSLIHI